MIQLFKNRITVGLVLFYIAGIYAGARFFSETIIAIGIFSAVLFLALGIFMLKDSRRTTSFCLAACLLFFTLGITYASYTAKNRQGELRSFIGKECYVYGTVISSPKLTQKGNHYSVTVDVHKIVENGNSTNLKGRISVYVSHLDNTAPQINQPVYFYGMLENPDYEDGNFNYNEFLRTKDIYATCFTQKIYPYYGNDLSFSFFDKIKFSGRELKVFFTEKIDNLFFYDKDAKAMIKGILLGEREDFSEELSNNLSLSGFSHVVAVSGLHLNILFGALCGLLGFLTVHRKVTALMALPIILLFAAITGFTPSICRAAVMLTICILGLLFKKEYDSINALFISAFIILSVNPYALFSISFILSFMSTLAIILLYSRIYGIFRLTSKSSAILKFLASSLSVSAAAFIGTAPFIAYYFGIVSISSFIANILVIPLTAPIFILGYILCLISSFVPAVICNMILAPLAFWIELLIQTANIFAHMSFLHFEIKPFSPIYILIYGAAIILFFAKPKKEL